MTSDDIVAIALIDNRRIACYRHRSALFFLLTIGNKDGDVMIVNISLIPIIEISETKGRQILGVDLIASLGALESFESFTNTRSIGCCLSVRI
jgi:hypothetical protein